jgi:hypothetical protein
MPKHERTCTMNNFDRIETAAGLDPAKKGPRSISEYLKRALAEAKRKNPLVTGLTYARGKITFRYAKQATQRQDTPPQATLATLKEFFNRKGH